MDVKDLVARIVTTIDPSGLRQFQQNVAALTAPINNLNAAMKAVNTSLAAVGGSSSALGKVVITVSALAAGAQETGRAFNNVGQAISGAGAKIAQGFATGPLSPNGSLGGVVRVLENIGQGFLSMAGRALNAVNPVNLIGNALGEIAHFAQVGFAVAIIRDFEQLGQAALNLIGQLSPLSTGVLAGQFSNQLAALSAVSANVGQNFGQLTTYLNSIRASGIEAGAATQALSQAMQEGFKPDEIQKLSLAGQNLAQILGTNSTDAFNQLFRAISTMNVQALRTSGIFLSQEQIFANYATKTGKSISEVTSNLYLMRAAFLDAVLTATNKFAGAYQDSLDTLGKKLSSFPRQLDDLRLAIGRVFEPWLNGGFTIVQDMVEAMTRLFTVTQQQALATAAATLSQQNGIKLTSKDLNDLIVGMQAGGPKMEAAFAKVAASSGATVDQLHKMAAAGDFAETTLSKLGHVFEDTTLTQQLRGLGTAVGSIFSNLTTNIFQKLFYVNPADVGKWAQDMVQNGIKGAANLANGILTGINQFVIPAITYVLTQILNILKGGAITFTQAGVDIIKSLVTGILGGLGSAVSSLAGALGGIFNALVGGLGNALLIGSDAKNWGAKAVTDAGRGMRESADSAAGDATQAGRTTGNALTNAATEAINNGASAVKNAVKGAMDFSSWIDELRATDVSVIGQWGKGINQAILNSLTSYDFTPLNYLEGVISQLFGSQGSAPQQVPAIQAVTAAISELEHTGSITAGTMAALQSAFGAAFTNIQNYLVTINAVNEGLKAQEADQRAVELATRKVQEAQFALSAFQLQTVDIPERYTRGRKAELEITALAAQREAQQRQNALQDQEYANQLLQHQLQLQQGTLDQLTKMAQLQAQIASQKLATTQPVAIDTAGIDTAIKKIGADLQAQIIAAFAPAREQMGILGAFLIGFSGGLANLPGKPKREDFPNASEYADALKEWEKSNTPLSNAAKAGAALRDLITQISTISLKNIIDGFTTMVAKLERLVQLAQAFGAGLLGGNNPGKTGKDDVTDPGLNQAYGAGAGVADFAAKTAATIQQVMKDLQPLFKAVQDFNEKNPKGIPLLALALGADFLSGGALHSAAIGIVTALGAGITSLGGTAGGIIVGALVKTIIVAFLDPAAWAPITGALGGLLTALTNFVPSIVTTLSTAWNSATYITALTGGGLLDSLELFFLGLPAALATTLVTVAGTIVGGILYQLAQSAGILGPNSESIGQMIAQLGAIIKSKGVDGLKEVGSGFWKNLTDGLIAAATTGVELLAIGPLIIGGLSKTILDNIAKVIPIVQPFVDAIETPFKWLVDHLVGHSIIPDLITAIIGLFVAAPSSLTSPMAAVVAAISGPFNTLKDSLIGPGGVFSQISDGLGSLWNKISGQGAPQPKGNASQGVSKGGNPAASAQTPGSDLAAGFQQSLTGLTTAIDQNQVAAELDNKLVKPSKAVLQDLITAIGSVGTKAISGFTTFATNVAGAWATATAATIIGTTIIASSFTVLTNSLSASSIIINASLTGVSNGFNNLQNSLSGTLSNILGNVNGFTSGVFNSIFGMYTSSLLPLASLTTAISGISTGFWELGTAVRTVMGSISTTIVTTVTRISTSMVTLGLAVTALITRLNNAFKGIGDPVILLMTNFVNRLVELFTKLFDQLVGHSIVPDMMDAVVHEFTQLKPRVVGPLTGFKDSVEGKLKSISPKTGLSNGADLSGTHGKGRAGGLTVTVNQTGWVFPSDMGPAQQDTLRKIAREEAYTGIVLAFNKASN